MLRSLFLVSALFLIGLLSAAQAQTRVIVPCPEGPHCSTEVSGHIDAFGTARLPWVVSVAAPAGVCLFFQKITSDGPILRSAIAPNGVVFRAVDPNGIQVKETIAGWYTFQFDTPPPGREQIFRASITFLFPANCPGTPGR